MVTHLSPLLGNQNELLCTDSLQSKKKTALRNVCLININEQLIMNYKQMKRIRLQEAAKGAHLIT